MPLKSGCARKNMHSASKSEVRVLWYAIKCIMTAMRPGVGEEVVSYLLPVLNPKSYDGERGGWIPQQEDQGTQVV